MNSREISVYLREADTQCRLVIGAVAALNNAMQVSSQERNGPTDWQRFEFIQGEVFRSLHSLLTHASNVSRLFWPPTGKGEVAQKREERGRLLRQRVGLPDDNHPLKNRTLRDHLEHFDERIDDWRETSVRKNYVQDIVGPKGMIVGLEEEDMMRWYDPSQKRFIFRGEDFNIQDLVAAIDQLQPLLKPAVEAANDEDRHVRNPSIERDVQRLSPLDAPHVKRVCRAWHESSWVKVPVLGM